MPNRSTENPIKQAISRLLRKLLKPILHPYTITKTHRHFATTDEAMRWMTPLFKNPEAQNYHRFHLQRYWTTMEYLADLPRSTRVLEIGAPPYGMTVLMAKFLFQDISVSGYDEKSPNQLQNIAAATVAFTADDGTILYRGEEQRFNLEIHKWPYRDGEFDLVISCETFEHLGLDPMHAYTEANRVLKTGGRLFITVPNGIALSNGMRFLTGQQPNSFPFYRPEGFSLRHQREPTPREVRTLLSAAGFQPEFVETFNVQTPTVRGLARLVALCLLSRPLDQRRELLAARGIKTGPPSLRFPTDEQLYYPWDLDRLRKQTPGTPSP